MDVSEGAIEAGTGRTWSHWQGVLDRYGTAIGHTERVKRLQAEHPELSGWWAQSLCVEFERARGLREVGQSCDGDFQVSCTKTLSADVDQAWQRLTTVPFLGRIDWETGTEAHVDGARIEVRRCDPGAMLRWFWSDDDGKSTVEVTFQDKGDRCAVTFRHHGLTSRDAMERYRARWKAALQALA